MRLLKKILIGIGNTVLGYLSIPGLFLGFMLATNSSKGWGVEDKDGQIFIPLGIILLIVLTVLLVMKLWNSIKRATDKTFDPYTRYIENNLFFIGSFVYGVHCLVY